MGLDTNATRMHRIGNGAPSAKHRRRDTDMGHARDRVHGLAGWGAAPGLPPRLVAEFGARGGAEPLREFRGP